MSNDIVIVKEAAPRIIAVAEQGPAGSNTAIPASVTFSQGDVVLGRTLAGPGVGTEIPALPFGRSILAAANVAALYTILGTIPVSAGGTGVATLAAGYVKANGAAPFTSAVTIPQADVTNLVADLAGKVPVTRTITAGVGLSGGGDLSANRTIDLANTAVTPNTYGSATRAPVFIVDAQGRLSAATDVLIAPAFASITAKPTSLAGYGITDGQLLNATLTALSGQPTIAYGIGFLNLANSAAARTYMNLGTASQNNSGDFDPVGTATASMNAHLAAGNPHPQYALVASGYLPVNNPVFTGVMTGPRYVSDVAIGTAPFTVTSTTLVPNLYVARAALADGVTINANLTGPITSVGNATSVASQTGTGSTFVMNTSPTLVTPVLGVATGTSYQGIIGNVSPATGAFTTLAATTSLSLNAQVTLFPGGANILEQRNGVSAQTFRVYNTYTDASNYERLRISWSANAVQLFPEAAGTGAATRAMVLGNSANDYANKVVVSGITYAVRIGTSASTAVVEGVDTTGVASYQPLQIGGSAVTIQANGASVMRVSALGVQIGVGTAAASLDMAVNLTSTSWTTNGIGLRLRGNTYTDSSTAIAGTAVTNHIHAIAAPTLAATNTTVTTTTAATLYIAGAPIAGTNMVITNPLALQVAAGGTLFGGLVGVGILPQTGALIFLSNSTGIATGTIQRAYASSMAVTASGTTYGAGFVCDVATAAASFTVADIYGLLIQAGSLGAGSTITRNTGVFIADLTTGVTNYGVRIALSSGASKFNVFADGTAQNFFAGNINLTTGVSLGWGTSTTPDVLLTRSAPAILQQGAADAAVPVAQTLRAQGSRAGTDTNVGGASYTIQSGQGTGTGTASSLIFRTSVVVGAGTGAQTMTTALTLTGANGVFAGTVTGSHIGSLGSASPNTVAATSITGTSTLRMTGFATFGSQTAGAAQIDLNGNVSAASWTVDGIGLRLRANTYTNSSTAAAGTAVTGHIHAIAVPILVATNTTVITTTAATFYIAGAPTAGTNMTITNRYALIVATGNTLLGGDVHIGASDLILTRAAAATLQFGAANSATPVSHVLQSQGSRPGTDNNIGGANYTIQSGTGTGTGAASNIILRAPILVASGTGVQTMVTVVTLSGLRASMNLPFNLKTYTVATLPAGSTGDSAYVTDALAPTFLVAVAGGGTVITPVFYNGTAWVAG